jgi:hypothetical protein
MKSSQAGLKVPSLVIDWDTADSITEANLKDVYGVLVKEVKIWNKIKKTKHHQQEELDYYIAMRDHVKAVLGYFGVEV